MDRFLVHYAVRFDAEGRLALRAPSRAPLAGETLEDASAHGSPERGSATRREQPNRFPTRIEEAKARARRSRSERSAPAARGPWP